MSVIVDSTTYDVSVRSIRRKVRFERKYLKPTVDGTMQTELIGVYYDYQLVLNEMLDDAEYAAFHDKLAEATGFHTVTVPANEDSTLTFSAYFERISDEISIQKSGTNYWTGLTVDFIARSPERTP